MSRLVYVSTDMEVASKALTIGKRVFICTGPNQLVDEVRTITRGGYVQLIDGSVHDAVDILNFFVEEFA